MRMAMIVLPVCDNNGHEIESAHATIKATLSTFGGWTRLQSFGGWTNAEGVDYIEAGYTYLCAMDDTIANADKLRSLAATVRELARQECVMIQQANGTVEFI